MHILCSVLVVLFIATLSPPSQAGESGEAAPKNDAGYNYNLGAPSSAEDEEDEVVSAKPLILQSKRYNLTPDSFQKIALKVLLKQNWRIEANETTRVQGSYIKSGKTYKVELRFTGDTIVIGFIPGFHHSSNGWLRKLAKQLKIEAAVQRREAEAQRYMNK